MASSQNICNNCQTINPLGNTQCISCSNTLVPIHNRDDIVQQFVSITAATREQAETLLEISNTVDDAVNLFFDTGGIESMDIDEENDDFTNQFNNIINNPRFSNMMQRVVSEVLSGQTDINSLLQNVTNRTIYYPKNTKELTMQLLYGWGKEKPHFCEICCSRALIKFIKIKNMEKHEIINLIPQYILNKLELTTTQKRNQSVDGILQEIDSFFTELCSKLVETFSNVYYNFNIIKQKYPTDYLQRFLNRLEEYNSQNFRIIWQSLHQSNLDSIIPKEDRVSKIIDLVHSQEFISYVLQSWDSKTYNHPAPKEVLDCLKQDVLDSEQKLQQYNLKEERCAICMDTFTVKQDEPTKITLLGCHTFCTECIMPWLQECNDTCPNCRKKIEKVE
jgi:hypothetical protein